MDLHVIYLSHFFHCNKNSFGKALRFSPKSHRVAFFFFFFPFISYNCFTRMHVHQCIHTHILLYFRAAKFCWSLTLHFLFFYFICISGQLINKKIVFVVMYKIMSFQLMFNNHLLKVCLLLLLIFLFWNKFSFSKFYCDILFIYNLRSSHTYYRWRGQVYTEVYFYPFFPYLYTCTDWMFYHQQFVIVMELVLCL